MCSTFYKFMSYVKVVILTSIHYVYLFSSIFTSLFHYNFRPSIIYFSQYHYPGSGTTFTIFKKVLSLIQRMNMLTFDILATLLTNYYSNKAALTYHAHMVSGSDLDI